MPVLTHLGPAAPCGPDAATSRTPSARSTSDNLFACCFNLHKVTPARPDAERGDVHDRRTRTSWSSDNLDFHPTDVLEDADGSLLVVDTGGWYKLCCPTSQLVKPDVLGAIYRVRGRAAAKIDDPRGPKIDWEKATADRAVRSCSTTRARRSAASRRGAWPACGRRQVDAAE